MNSTYFIFILLFYLIIDVNTMHLFFFTQFFSNLFQNSNLRRKIAKGGEQRGDTIDLSFGEKKEQN